MTITKRLRFFVLERDRFRCYYCKRNDVPLQVDHFIPRALGGQDIPQNLRAACADCNYGKGTTLVESLTPDTVRATMQSLRPKKRKQLQSSIFEPPDALTRYYIRSISGFVGRGWDISDAADHLIEKSPDDKDEIATAVAEMKAKWAKKQDRLS